MITAKVLTAYNDKVQIIADGEIIKLTRNELESKLKQGEIQINMPTVSCIDITKDSNNNIVSYLLKDDAQKQKWVTPEQLKSAIYNYRVKCDNIMLTSDYRLKQRNIEYEVDAILASIKMFGNKSGTIETGCDTPCMYVDYSENEHLLVIPNEVTDLYDDHDDDYRAAHGCAKGIGSSVNRYIRRIHGKLTVIGGCNLKAIHGLFYKCKLESLDVSSLDTSNIVNMGGLFQDSNPGSILDLSSFDTSNVENMRGMFRICRSNKIILKSFNTSNATHMKDMFDSCFADELDLSSFDIKNVKTIGEMPSFYHCKAKLIDISSFDVNKLLNSDLDDLFLRCHAKIKVPKNRCLLEMLKDKGIEFVV